NFAVMKSAELLRNLALLSTELPVKKKFLLHSIDVITKEIALNTLTSNDFLNLIELSNKLDRILDLGVLEENKLYYHKKSGVIINTNKGWLISNQLTSFNESLECNDSLATLSSLYNGRIKLVTDNASKERYQSLTSYSTNFWGTYI